MITIQLVLVLISIISVNGHLAMWNPAMYGWDPNDPNQSNAVIPLMHLPFDQWWFHGFVNQPPAANTFLELPAGGTLHAEVACNKALTSFGAVPSQQTGIYACDGDGPTGGIGALHTSDAWATPYDQLKDVKGCGLGIVYESDVSKIKPEDFAVVSTNWSCPWFKHVDFQIPADLPACPEGGCHCMWGWIHGDDAGSEQMYMIGYRCQVTGATVTTPIPAAKTANKCDYPTDTSNCTVGPRQPHYWYQAEQNNNPQGQYDPPFYNGAYGFMNGAQTDLFSGVDVTSAISQNSSSSSGSSSSSSSSSPSSSSVSSSSSGSTAPDGSSSGSSQTSSSSSSSSSTSSAVAMKAAMVDSKSSPSSATTSIWVGAKPTCRVRGAKKKRTLMMDSSSHDHLKRHQAKSKAKRGQLHS